MSGPGLLPSGSLAGLVRVIDAGARTTLQDLGRPGHAHLGIPASGAADIPAATLANRLVGNAEGAPVLETTLRGPELRFDAPVTVAVTGAEVEVTVDGRPAAMHAPFRVRSGSLVRIGQATRGLRSYVAVRGGFDAPLTLGSASHDELTGLGPAPLKPGDRIDLGSHALDAPTVDVAPVAPILSSPVLHVVPGPRDDWFAPDALTTLLGVAYTVSDQVNRIGARLRGPQLQRRTDDELRSEGIARGSIQVPPSGWPILLLADHPTTGGYPVIAVVSEADLPAAAQLRPGDIVRFRLRRPPAAEPRSEDFA
ncbi:MAG: biotin-dependent carboxyltransferase family protein [Solirubrobacteraceae bacterium]|nr:biotin-dependent carboxyltransferase family protein [Patulibacter sp.]